jgi:hypothetical protein
MRQLLAATSSPDVNAAAIELANRDSSLPRAAGLELLAVLQPSSESYALAMRGVATATDPDVLAAALFALKPPGPSTQTDARTMLPRLVELTRDPDALVRAHAVQQIAEWDKIGDQATPIVQRAFLDGDGTVRKAAVGAVMIGQLRSDGLKLALLRVISEPTEDLVTRAAALNALERFSVTEDELTTYLARRRDIERLAMTH